MKYDDASWHYGADDFPRNLPAEACDGKFIDVDA